MENEVIELGGKGSDALFLEAVDFTSPSGRRIIVRKRDHTDERANTIARHFARYYPAALVCRPARRILDFPCGSGYAAPIFRSFGVQYQGLDYDQDKVAYAQHVYGADGVTFSAGDLTNPDLPADYFDVIACLEGIEHVKKAYQAPLIAALRRSLRSSGVLVISSPENVTGVSGPNPYNPWHLHELNKIDFLTLLKNEFGPNVEPFHFCETLTDGQMHTCWLAFCHNAPAA